MDGADSSVRSKWSILTAIVLTVLLFCLGAWMHLGLGRDDPGRTLFGDLGDGLFNLWILEHVSQNLLDGPHALNDGRIFYPNHEETLWWSDNLIALSPVYAASKAITAAPLAAYWWTTQILSFIGFVFLVWLFTELRRSFTASGYRIPHWTIPLIPIIAYASFFTLTRIGRYPHFQHLSSCFVTLLLIGGLRFLRGRKKRDAALMLLAEALLFYSAPYYAVLGLLILIIVALLVLLEQRESPLTLLLKYGWLVLLLLLTVLYPAYHYSRGDHAEHSLDHLRHYSMEPIHFFIPPYGWLKTFIETPADVFTTKGYPGMGMTLGLMLAAAGLIVALRKPLGQLLASRLHLALLIVFAVTFIDAKEIKNVTAYLRLVIPVIALLLIARHWRVKKPKPVTTALLLILGSFVMVYGTAMGPCGPEDTFWEASFKPHVWDVCAGLIPGYGSMRELIRFAVIGQAVLATLLFGALLFGLSRPSRRIRLAVLSAAGVLLLLQVSEQKDARALTMPINPSKIALPADVEAAAADLSGVLAAIPAEPFQYNPLNTIRWVGQESIVLLNGYSGRSTQIFDFFMEVEKKYGTGSRMQLEVAREFNVNFLYVEKRFVTDSRIEDIRDSMTILVETDQFLLAAFPALQPVESRP